MNIILLGPQGSGKGTQAQLLTDKYDFNHFEAGKILRSIADSDNPNADSIKGYIDHGGLVPDELIRLIAWDYVSKHAKTNGFLFDGYPRSIAQYDHLGDMLAKFGQKIDFVINLEISEPETIKRLSARRTCSKCGEIYNLLTNPPKSGSCDKCGGELIHRTDDQPEAIKRRLSIYRAQTQPVFEKALIEGMGYEINGEQAIDQVFKDIIHVINHAKN